MSPPLQFYTLPNLITACRIVLIPVTVYAVYIGVEQQQLNWLIVALVCLILGEVTDFADGFFARRTGAVSNVGKLLDPMSDSLFRMCVFLSFLTMGWIDLWMTCLIFARDITVAYLRVFAALQQMVLAARQSGKIKAIAQAVCQIGIVLLACIHLSGLDVAWLGFDLSKVIQVENAKDGLSNNVLRSGGFSELAWWFSLMATLITTWSGIDYTVSVVRTANEK
ncbi:MAG: CDP-diacylglycerol--glycerol-3-phosphate 3-phosphatidyltransferase [Proteobacteria bacterium]|nr:CDP-diacylglycerol--glycerol-3-phosphate 3-phosphatidyltransferase [Pseudomonadota bacterium]